jgi:hypothetical protein
MPLGRRIYAPSEKGSASIEAVETVLMVVPARREHGPRAPLLAPLLPDGGAAQEESGHVPQQRAEDMQDEERAAEQDRGCARRDRP